MTTIIFFNLPRFSTPIFQQDGVTITGSGNVVGGGTDDLDGGGRSGTDLGINDNFIDPGEFIEFSFDAGAASGVSYVFGGAGNTDGDDLVGEGNLEAFDVNGNSLGVLSSDARNGNISSLFGNQLISRFRLAQIEELSIFSLIFTSVPVVIQAETDAVTTSEDDPITFNVRTNDTLSPSGLSPTLSFNTTGLQGSLTDNGNGSFTYTPAPSFQSLNTGQSATTSFQYTLTSGSRSSTATVTLTINGLTDNQPPTAVNDSATVTEGQTVNIAVLTNDSDPDGNTPLSLDSFTAPTNGTVTQNPNGTLSYKANLNFAGTDSFTYIAKDSNGAKSNPATVSVTVTPLNLTGTLNNDNLIGTSTNNSIVGLLGNDSLNGGAGDDTLTGGFGADRFVFASGKPFATLGWT
jgi:VCBS repeat-containing protein